MMKAFLVAAFIALPTTALLAQSPMVDTKGHMGLGTTQPDQSAILDLHSTNAGLLLPRLSQAEINGIPNPATGLVVFNTTTGEFNYNFGTPGAPQWSAMLSSQGNSLGTLAWVLKGNDLSSATNPVLGTTSPHDLTIVTGGAGNVRINIDDATGAVNIRTNTDVDGTLNADGAITAHSTLNVDGATTLGTSSNPANLTLHDGDGNSAAITTANLTANRNYTIPEAGDNADFLMTRGNQTIEGTKSFTDPLRLVNSGGAYSSLAASASQLTNVKYIMPAEEPQADGDVLAARSISGSGPNDVELEWVSPAGAFAGGDNVQVQGNLVVHGDLQVYGRIIGYESGNELGDGNDVRQLTIHGDGNGGSDHLYVEGNARVTRNFYVDNDLSVGGFTNFSETVTPGANAGITISKTVSTVTAGTATGNFSYTLPAAMAGRIVYINNTSGFTMLGTPNIATGSKVTLVYTNSGWISF